MTRLQLQAAPQRSCSAGSRRTKAGVDDLADHGKDVLVEVIDHATLVSGR